MKIHGFNKLTLLDYPGQLAALVFTGGCNMRCPFCHNASLVLHPDSQPVLSEDDILSVLRQRAGILEGVCISGGEPTLEPDLPDFIRKIKELGLLVKLDTNGTHPQLLEFLIKENLIDYIAMDIKASLDNYPKACGSDFIKPETILSSARIIMSSGVKYEFRTTVVDELHSTADFEAIGKWLQGAQAYYLQTFKDSGDLIEGGFHAAPREKMLKYKELLLPYIKNVEFRGLD